MSEESLLSEATETTTETAAEETTTDTITESTTETSWLISDGLEGTGDKPDFMLDKYHTMADQAKAYPELASKFGGFTGAPDDYEMSMPDGIDGEIATDDPLVGEFQTWAKENNLNQDGFTNILHMFIKNEYETTGTNRETELNAIGDNAQERLQNVSDFAKANMSENGFEGLKDMLTTASGMTAVEELIGLTRSLGVPSTSTAVAETSKTDIRERMSDPRYASDPDFRKETDALWGRIVGNGPQTTTVG